MTSQIQDKLMYRGLQYNIIGISGTGLLSPRDFGMAPIAFSSGCIRGYYREYSCVNETLILAALALRLNDGDEYKPIKGITPLGDPETAIDDKFSMYKYFNLEEPTLYSGGLLIAKDYVEKAYGITRLPQSYKSVLELIFSEGILRESIDQSAMVAKNRNETLQKKLDHYPEIKFLLTYDFFYSSKR